MEVLGFVEKGWRIYLRLPQIFGKVYEWGFGGDQGGEEGTFHIVFSYIHLVLFHCHDYFAQGIDLEIEKDGMKLQM